MTAPAQQAQQKGRSRNYPAFGLSEAIQKARQLYDRDGKAVVPTDVAVQAWGYKGLNGSSLRALAALKTYGLLEEAPNKSVRLSNRALAILLEPEGSPDRATAIREAAGSPAIFAELQEHYGENIPSDPAIMSHLVRNENFSEEAANTLIAAFRDTLALAERTEGSNITPGGLGASTKQEPPVEKPGARVRSLAPPGDRHMEFTWPLSGDAVATLTVTKTLDAEDIETLTEYFAIAKKALGKAAKAAAASKEGEKPEDLR